MKRFLVFAALFPPLALVVFNAPDVVMHRDFKLLDFTTLGLSYAIAIIPALILAAVDSKWRSLQGTTIAGALMSGSIAFFLWDGFRELFPALMAFLLGGVPAAVCSWLSKEQIAATP
jgi:hypothetical protein